nr:HD domain-containing protein [Bacteroidetes bacterium endosymbiont of Geopemphigus sp.]
MKKLKKINDPMYGLISIRNLMVQKLIDHPYFQRLRYISQTGLAHLVYPGAQHTRFHHALGALNLMQRAVETLRMKKISITHEEEQGVYIAILLHDIGHGPFSHVLEKSIVVGTHHEDLSRIFIRHLNKTFSSALDLAQEMFEGRYPKKFLCQLISSQLDMDRMDYLQRDSFYTGVAEGAVSADRLISMLNVSDNELVFEINGLPSIENFLISRMFMYWQVYLHKTSLGAERLLIHIFRRAKERIISGDLIEASICLMHFLKKEQPTRITSFDEDDLRYFVMLDDTDVWQAIKQWQYASDRTLSLMSQMLINRKLLKVKISERSFSKIFVEEKIYQVEKILQVPQGKYFVYQEKIENLVYHPKKNPIKLLMKNGDIRDILDKSSFLKNKNICNPMSKYYLCYLKG